ncbi:hypothetical protein BUALT_BualtUnG0000400 [Buddleja alternifolia]|uniref:Uncharacterized protein n=1 Tax=Buddleja alternifolia TaxID=168488 RepID=A0AAV6W723_9LAMI|nr:hypothetical protein BUALT_BualtUnG0000400 [Buddleja alternifolia]
MVKVALLCTKATPSVRPTMTEVVQMLEWKMDVPDASPEGSTYTNDVRFKAMKGFQQDIQNKSSTGIQLQSSTTVQTDAEFSSWADSDFNEISKDTMIRVK